MSGGELALREAIDWHLRLADGDSDLWHAFTDWLEADRAHADAYERVALDDRLLDDRPAEPRPIVIPAAPPPVRSRRPAMAMWGTGIAAMLVGGISLNTYLRLAASDPYVVVAPAGGSRSVTLPDGTQVALNDGARLRLDHARPRLAVLESGEALFRVRHNAADPFRVEAAGRVIEDVGTVFDVSTRGAALRVAVAEGSVAFRSGGDHILLKPGMAISTVSGDEAEMHHVDPATVGGWRTGHVDFDDVRLTDVAEQLRLSNGVALSVSPDLADRRFSGVLRSDRGASEMVRSLAELSGTRAVAAGSGWSLEKDGAR
jgi:transmembrane sensor